MKVVVISASPRKIAKTQVFMKYVTKYIRNLSLEGLEVKLINLSEGGIDYYTGDGSFSDTTKDAVKNITEADVWIIGTPIYNSFFSSALKNLFEYIDYKKTAGKTAGLVIVAAGNSGFTDVQTLLTQLMSYFNVITNPRAVFVMADTADNDEINDEDVKSRLKQLVDETLGLASKVS
jgi:NAD(P)H-dependent FMN reductase